MIMLVPVTGNPIHVSIDKKSPEEINNSRIDCYPESESIYSNFSKQACLSRNCLFDDNATSDKIQCYFRSNYGYILQGNEQELKNGKRLRLKRNKNVMSPFSESIENVLLDVEYYTNDIIRFKLYDGDNKRYEVRKKKFQN